MATDEMAMATIRALAAIDVALGIQDDGCNSTEQTLDCISDMRSRIAEREADNAYLSDELHVMRARAEDAENALVDYAEHKGDCTLVCVRVPERLANRILSGKTSVADDAEWERFKVAAVCTCGLSKLLAACEPPK